MSACGEYEPLLHGLLDGELDAANAKRIEEHMAACPACAEEYRKLQALRASIRGAVVRTPAPERLKQRVRASLTRSRFPQRMAWPIAAALAACLMFGLFIPRGPDIGGEVAESHVRSLMANHLMDVASTDHHTVKPWFAGRLDFSPPVYDLAAQGFPLAGGRIDRVDGRNVAAVVYRHGAHVINLFIWPQGATDAAPTPAMVREGYTVLHWTKHGMTCWAVSDLNRAEMQQFETLVLQSNPI